MREFPRVRIWFCQEATGAPGLAESAQNVVSLTASSTATWVSRRMVRRTTAVPSGKYSRSVLTSTGDCISASMAGTNSTSGRAFDLLDGAASHLFPVGDGRQPGKPQGGFRTRDPADRLGREDAGFVTPHAEGKASAGTAARVSIACSSARAC